MGTHVWCNTAKHFYLLNPDVPSICTGCTWLHSGFPVGKNVAHLLYGRDVQVLQMCDISDGHPLVMEVVTHGASNGEEGCDRPYVGDHLCKVNDGL